VVPVFTVVRSMGEAPGFIPAASSRLRRSPSPRPPRPDLTHPPRSSPPVPPATSRYAPPPSPHPPDSSWTNLKRPQHRFLSYAFPSRSPGPAHLAVLNRPNFVAAAPTLPGISRTRLPPASPHRHDGEATKVSHLHPKQQRLTAHVKWFSWPPPRSGGGWV